MAFIIDEKGNYIPVLGESSGGGGGTSDHTQLTNLDYANAGHTGFMSSANFIPKDTIINIKTDGTGDFTKLSDAVTYLENKWSNGIVILQLGTGTFTESSTVTVNTGRFNIPHLQIKGTSKTDTIIKGKLYFSNGGSFIQLNDFGIEGTDSSTGSGIEYNFLTNTRISNIAVSKFARGVYLDWGGKAFVSNLTVTDVNLGVSANRGGEITLAGTYTATNVTTAVEVAWGSIIKLSEASKAFTNVTTQTNPTTNSMSTSGVILGGWSN